MALLSESTYERIEELKKTTPINDFWIIFAQSCKLARENKIIDDSLLNDIKTTFRSVMRSLNNALYNEDLTEAERDELGSWVHSKFVAFSLLGTWPSRSLRKPQSIAGDHHTIKQIYDDANQEKRAVGDVVNQCFLNEPACKAVYNRMNYVVDKIADGIKNTEHEDIFRAASVASGPAEEIFKILDSASIDSRKKFRANCIDIDFRACSYVHDTVKDLRLSDYVKVLHGDILKQATVKPLQETQNLVYSMGLIDYFKERACIKIINHMYSMLKPGGEIIIGNFHTSCTSRVFLDYILDWKLIYRTEEDMKSIFLKSHFGCEPTLDYEPCGVNMLARCTKR